MEKRISITPKEQLLKVAPQWRRKFAEESAEVLISEGRFSEIMTKISGITLADLSGEPAAVTLGKDIKRRKPKTASAVAQPSIKPPPQPKTAPSSEHTLSTSLLPVSAADPDIEIDPDFVTISIEEPSKKTEDFSKGKLGLFSDS